MWNLKSNTNEHIYKTQTLSQTQRTDLWLPRGKGSRRERRKPGKRLKENGLDRRGRGDKVKWGRGRG